VYTIKSSLEARVENGVSTYTIENVILHKGNLNILLWIYTSHITFQNLQSGAENIFTQFEKTAEMKKWKKEDWAFLVQVKLRDKVCETFNCLTHD